MADPATHHDAPTPALPLTLGYATGETRGRRFGWPYVLVLIAVILRLAYAQTQTNDPATFIALPDQQEYWQLGRSIINGEGLRFDDPATSEFLYAFRMPGYPLLVALCGAELPIVRAAQALLDGGSVLAVFLLTRRLRGEAAAVVAGFCVALHPYLIYFSATLLSETLFTAMLTWGIYLVLSSRAPARHAGLLLLLLGVFVRPSAIGLGVVAAAVLFWVGPRPALRAVAGVLVAGFVSVGALGLWTARNHHVLGKSVWTTTNSGYTAYDSFNPLATGASDQKSFRVTMTDPAVADAVGASIGLPYVQWQRLQALGEVGRNELFTRLAWDYVRQHPARVVTLAFAKLGRFWSPWPTSSDFGDWRYVVVGGGFVVPFFALVAIGMYRGGLPRRVTLILVLPALYFSAVHGVFVGSLRYRVPCDVPLAVLAGVGATSFRRPKAVAE